MILNYLQQKTDDHMGYDLFRHLKSEWPQLHERSLVEDWTNRYVKIHNVSDDFISPKWKTKRVVVAPEDKKTFQIFNQWKKKEFKTIEYQEKGQQSGPAIFTKTFEMKRFRFGYGIYRVVFWCVYVPEQDKMYINFKC